MIEMENQIRKKYVLPKNFIFYPAQFWAHKNHRLIIDSFKILKEKKTIMRCMFISAEQIKVIKIFKRILF